MTTLISHTTEVVNLARVQSPSRKGYTFRGWLYQEYLVKEQFLTPANNVILIAQWKKNKLSIERKDIIIPVAKLKKLNSEEGTTKRVYR